MKSLHSQNNHSMKQLPLSERPYEMCLSQGAQSLTDAQLLAVVLKTGCEGESALSLANKILQRNHKEGLISLYHTSLEEWKSIRGIGDVKAIQLCCIAELAKRLSKASVSESIRFSDPDNVAWYYMEDLRHQEQEILMLLMLDTKGRLIAQEMISKGTVNASLISPREIFLCALKHRCVSIILIHNHPSGNPMPSQEDLILTERIRDCGEMLGVELLDHIIIGDRCFVSFQKEKYLTSAK